MKIIELIVSNYKRVKAVTIKPLGEHVVIGGRNEQGKSSTIDALFAALCGSEAICDKPIREGALTSETVVNLGEYVVTRKFSPTGTILTVKNAEGKTQGSPQTLLDGLVGAIAFDPLAFTHMEPKAQRELLAKLAGLDFKLLDAEYQALYDKRRDANRDADKMAAKLTGRRTHEGVPEVEVSVEALLTELKSANVLNDRKTEALKDLNDAKRNATAREEQSQLAIRNVNQIRDALCVAERHLGECEKARENAINNFNIAIAAHTSAPEVDTAPITLRIVEADSINAKVRSNREFNGLMDESARLSEQVRALGRDLDAKAAQKAQAIRDAKYPLPGLTLSDDCVLFKGIPLKQASTEEQYRIGAAIGAALNPQLRVMVIRGGSLLDENNLVALLKWGNENDIQLIVERVGSGDECTVVIEDGEILK